MEKQKMNSLYSLYYHPDKYDVDPACYVFYTKEEAMKFAQENADNSDTDMLDLKSLREKGFCEFGNNGFAIIKPYKIGERIS